MNATGLMSAKALPGGARFVRCAFQVNPPHYLETFRGQEQTLGERDYVRELLDRCVALGVEIIAVTDHNHAGSIALFREEAVGRNITVFPGFEVASNEGVHVLCLYAPITTDAELQRFLGQLDITSLEPSTSLSKKSFTDLLDCVRGQGGLTIAAHVTHDKGLLHTLHGQARVNAWRHPHLLCAQIPGSVDEAPEDKRPILKNQDANYRREVAPDATTALAIVNAADVAKPEDLELPGATCWVKMSEPSLEGLRQAFLDPSSRIRLASDPLPDAHVEFIAMSWEGGFLDGGGVRFNGNLNVLIGGRGTGKSTIVESIRYVLGLEPLGKDAKATHDGIVKNVLSNGTKVSLLVRVHSPNRRDYTIERTVPNAPVVRDDTHQTLAIDPLDLVPGVQVFGQHEISELTKDGQKLTRLLDRFIGRDDVATLNKDKQRRALADSRERILKAIRERMDAEERLSVLPKLEETLKRYQDAGLEEKFQDKSFLIREEQILAVAAERLATVRSLAVGLRSAVPMDRAFVENISEELPAAVSLRGLDGVVERLEGAIARAASTIEAALAEAEAQSKAISDEWGTRRTNVEAAYERILRELQKSKIDGEEFVRLKKQIETLRPLREQRASIEQRISAEREVRRASLVEWDEAKAGQFRSLERAAKKVSKRLEDRVRVRVSFAAVRDELLNLIKEKIGGRLSEALETLRTHDRLSMSELAASARTGKDALVAKYGFVSTQAEKLAQAPESVWMEVEELDLAPTTAIELNTAAEGQSAIWQGLSELSTGQKATAVLLLLLLESDAPLVVDQPEDDLDNRFITESIVPKMREEKRRRQFVFATHNANLPVLGDAELIVGLSSRGGSVQNSEMLNPKHMGAIDAPEVRGLVEEVLEGGRRAFERRRLKYGF